jgi:hypothetical protein
VLNYTPGLLLIDNSHHQQLYHARTCRFDVVEQNPNYTSDAAMYAFNETGLLHYIDAMDERRGEHDRDTEEREDVRVFMTTERL